MFSAMAAGKDQPVERLLSMLVNLPKTPFYIAKYWAAMGLAFTVGSLSHGKI